MSGGIEETAVSTEPDDSIPQPQEADETSHRSSYRYRDQNRTQTDSRRLRAATHTGGGIVGMTAPGARTISLAEYSLPSERSLKNKPPKTQAEIAKEFSLLDIEGDGKLTFLRVKSALELMLGGNDRYIDGNFRGTDHDDVLIRSWLRENDPDVKGYVDWDDFLAIYTRANKVQHNSASSRYPSSTGEGVSYRMKGASSTAARRDTDLEADGVSDTAVRMMKLRK